MKNWRDDDMWHFARLLSKIGRPKLGGEGGSGDAREGVERPADASAPPCLASPPIHVDEDARRLAICGYCGKDPCQCRLRAERDALATQLAHEWGWPEGGAVLTRLRGDRTAMLVTFCEPAAEIYLGVRSGEA